MKKKLRNKIHSTDEMENTVSFNAENLSDMELSSNIYIPSRIDIFPNIHKFMKEQVIKRNKYTWFYFIID